ncbi:MAG: hypothetical protein JNL39_19170 [Opitutaceae bacterium]|nr:hypothetical protein [Opitutaceae bacterium]
MGLLAVSVVFFVLPGTRVRQGIFLAASVGFVATQVPDPAGWVGLTAFLAAGFFVARALQRRPGRWLLVGYLVALLAAFVVLKQYAFAKAVLPAALFAHPIAIVGLSYLLFRQIHVAVDAFQGQIGVLTPGRYLAYQLNLFGITAGPIQRYPQFCEDWDRMEPVLVDGEAILRAYRRVFLGVLKVSVFAALCLAGHERLSAALVVTGEGAIASQAKTMLWFMGAFYLYPAYIYFNFSGYCDIVIAGASLLGVRMPENFDRPFIARNMIEYWTRWHRTLGFWIRDYLFTPLYRAIASRWPERAASMAFACYFVALFLTGIWHGSTWNFVIFGLLNGLGVAAAKLWENHLIATRGRKGLKEYLADKRIRVVAVVANFHFVCLTIFFFPSDLERSILLLRRLLGLA